MKSVLDDDSDRLLRPQLCAASPARSGSDLSARQLAIAL
jgi:hypothetical protein